MKTAAADSAKERPSTPLLRRIQSPWLAAAVGGLCFLNTLGNDFTLDDRVLIVNNPRIQSLTHIRPIWLTEWWQPQDRRRALDDGQRDRLYRPLTMFTFAINHAIGGKHPSGYHVGNLLLHILTCWLVWSFTQRLFDDRGVSTGAALLFAVHPIHCEAVATMVGRAELLMTVFLLLAALMLMPRKRPLGLGRTLAAAAYFLFALLSQETALCYPLIALIVLHFHRRGTARPARRWIARCAVLAIPLLMYFPVRSAALDQTLSRDRQPSVPSNTLFLASPAARAVMPLTIAGMYTRLVIVPDRLSTNYGVGVLDASAVPGLLTVLGLAAGAGLLIALWGYRARSVLWRRCAASAAMVIVSYALISNTFMLIGVAVAERLAYWISVPVFILITTLALALWRARFAPRAGHGQHARASVVVGIAFLATYGLRSVFRNMDWINSETITIADVETYPDGIVQNTRMGQLLAGSGGTQEARRAIPYLERALAGYPRFPKVLYLLGRAYVMLGDRPRAVYYLTNALVFDPARPDARWLLTAIQSDQRDLAARIESLQAAVTTRPSNAALFLELGRLLRGAARRGESLAALSRAAELAPSDAAVVNAYAEALALNDQSEQARSAFARVVALDPRHWQAHSNLSRFLADVDPPAALLHAYEAVRLKPDVLQTNVNLAEAFAANRRLDDAVGLYRRIESGLTPGDLQREFVRERIRELQRQRP